MFTWKKVLDGKTNPASTKAMAMSPWLLTSGLLTGFFDSNHSKYLFLISDISYIVSLPIAAFSVYTDVSSLWDSEIPPLLKRGDFGLDKHLICSTAVPETVQHNFLLPNPTAASVRLTTLFLQLCSLKSRAWMFSFIHKQVWSLFHTENTLRI